MIYNYVTTCLPTGKQYVGMHKSNFLDDYYLGSGKILRKAIEKYGRQNFKREILEFHNNIEDAYKREEFWINKLNTLSPNGYNISPTGGGQLPKWLLKQIGIKVSKKVRGSGNGMFNKKHTEESKEKMRMAKRNFVPWNKGLIGDKNPQTGKKRSLEARLNISKGKIGDKNPMYGVSPWNKDKRKNDL